MLIFNQLKFIKNYLWVWLILSFIATHINIGLINKILFPDYSAYFIAGCVFYLIYLEGLDLNKLSLVIASYVLASKRAWILLHNELIPNYRTEFEIPIILAIMSLFYIVFFLIAKNKTSLLRSDKWLILGALTYPLYLIHQNIGYMVFNNLHTHINHYALLIGTIFGMLILAYLVHEFVEKKFAVKLKNLLTKII
jgi:peptidoglycan/LPS O-acetylase OafA/YrhL